MSLEYRIQPHRLSSLSLLDDIETHYPNFPLSCDRGSCLLSASCIIVVASFFIAGLLVSRASSASITWELNASRWRPAFSSHLISPSELSVATSKDKRQAGLPLQTSRRGICLDLFPPSQTARLLGTEVEQIKKSIRAFNVADKVTDVRAMREQGINGFNEFIFVYEDTLLNFRVNAAPGLPELDASRIAAGTTAFIVRTTQMDQVASRATPWIGFLCGSIHSRTKVRHRARIMRLSTKRL